MTAAEQSEQNPAYRLDPFSPKGGEIVCTDFHLNEDTIMIKCNHCAHLSYFSQELRKNMTPQEKHLWYDFLKTLPLTVHRQKVIDQYIADFYIASEKLVIELDGSQHFTKKGKSYDSFRDAHFRGLGLTVLRYSNADIQYRFDEVCADIKKHLRNTAL